MQTKLMLPVAVLAAVPFVMVLGNSMLIPVFPQMKTAMDITQFDVGLLITAFSLPAALVIPFAGALSDHVGRRTIMAPALILYGAGGLVAGAAAWLMENPYPVILAGRVVQGIGAGGTYQLAIALAGDIFTTSERTKVLGVLEAANGLGKIISPLLGAAVALIVWFVPFFVYGFTALPVAAAVWFIVREPKPTGRHTTVRKYWNAIRTIIRQRGMPLVTSYFVGMAALFLLFGILAFLSDDLEQRFGIRGFRTGLMLAIPVTTMAIMAYVAGVFLQKRIPLLKPAILAGLAVAALALSSAVLVQGTLGLYMAAFGLLGIGIGVLLPALNMLITSAAPQEERGLVVGLYGTVRFAGVAVGPPAFALAVAMGRPTMFFGAAGLAALALLIAWVALDPKQLLIAANVRAKKAG